MYFFRVPYGKKGWIVFDLESHQTFISQDVIFEETNFPYTNPSSFQSSSLPNTPHLANIFDLDDLPTIALLGPTHHTFSSLSTEVADSSLAHAFSHTSSPKSASGHAYFSVLSKPNPT